MEDLNATITKDPRYFVQKLSDPELAGCNPDILWSDVEGYNDREWYITGLASLIVTIFGLMGNMTTCLVFIRQKMMDAFNQLLIALATMDILFLLFSSYASIIVVGYEQDEPEWAVTVRPYAAALAQVMMTASVLMLVSLTWERHFAICYPHQYRIRIRTIPLWRHLAQYIVPVVVLSFVLNIPTFINTYKTLAILKENSNYLTISFHYRLFHPLLTTCIAPLIILFCMNIRIYLGVRRLQQSQQRRRQNQERALQNGNSRQGSKQGKKDKKEIQMAGVALTIVLSFVALNMLRLILGFNEVLDIRQIATCMKHKVEFMRSMDSYTLDSLSRFLMIVNSSCNFIIYVSFNANFKKGFKDLIGLNSFKCCRDRLQRSDSINVDASDNSDDKFEELEEQQITTVPDIGTNGVRNGTNIEEHPIEVV